MLGTQHVQLTRIHGDDRSESVVTPKGVLGVTAKWKSHTHVYYGLTMVHSSDLWSPGWPIHHIIALMAIPILACKKPPAIGKDMFESCLACSRFVSINVGLTAETKTKTKTHLVQANTVNLTYKDHNRDRQNVVLIHRGSLYTGSITGKVYTGNP